LKKLDLGQTISIVANFGVIAGIVFLGIELRQNNEYLAAQASLAQFSIERDRRSRFIDNTNGINELLVKQFAGQPLTPAESLRLDMLSNEILDSWRWQFREYQAGRLPIASLDLELWRDQLAQIPALREQFENDRDESGQDFVQFMEENVIDQVR